MRRRRSKFAALASGLGVCLGLAACGAGARQDVGEPSGDFNVQIQRAAFPASQRLAQHSHMVIAVRNADQRTIPDIAVTIDNPNTGSSVAAFGYKFSSPSLPELASRSRPVWIVDQAPESNGCRHACREGGPGGAVSAYSNTWALGPLKPGATVTFDWAVTAVHAGTQTVRYRVAAGLNGKAHAVLAGGGTPQGSFTVSIAKAPSQAYVNDAGQVVTSR